MFTQLRKWWHKFVLKFRTDVNASYQIPYTEIPNSNGETDAIPKPPPPPTRPVPPPAPEPPRPQAEAQPEPEQSGEPPSIKHRDTTYLHLRRELVDIGQYMLDRFENLHTHRSAAEYSKNDLNLLAELWGCDFLVMDPDLGKRMKGGDKWSAIGGEGNEAELAEALWPIDYAIAYQADSEELDKSDPGVILYRIHTVTARQVRGKVRRVAHKMIHYVVGCFHDDGTWTVFDGYAGMIGKKWILLQPEADDWPVEIKHERNDWFAKIMSCALTARYEWHVAFGTIPGGPRLLFPTNPTAALNLFKYRDKMPGKNRRQMLKHWVEQHWRDTVADLQYVCNHLRGHTHFNWCGFGCELFVSAFDLEKNEVFKKEAKAWRAQRKHNRVRVHIKKGAAPDSRPTMH